MRAVTTGEPLAHATGWITRFIPGKSGAPVLAGVLLIADEHGLRLRATDWETFGEVRVKAAVTGDGQALVSGRLLGNIAKAAAKAADVEIVAEGPAMTVTAGRSTWTLPTIPDRDYPTFAEAGDPIATLDGAVFAAALARVLPAADKVGNAPLHSGVILTGADDLAITTTDRYRLADAVIPWTPNDDAGVSEVHLQVTASLLEFVARTGGSGPVHLGANGRTVSFTSETHTIIGREIGEDLPKMRGLIPTTERAGWATVSALDLLGAVADANAVAESELPMRLTFTEEELTVSLAEHGGQSVAAIPVTGCGGKLPELWINAPYVTEAVRAAGSEQVWFGFDTTPTRPVLVMALGDDGEPRPGYTHLVMGRRPPAAAGAS